MLNLSDADVSLLQRLGQLQELTLHSRYAAKQAQLHFNMGLPVLYLLLGDKAAPAGRRRFVN